MQWTNFSDGLWLPETVDYQVPPNSLLRADNVEYMTGTGLRGRRGRLLLGTVPNKAISLWRHYPRTGTPSTLAANDDGAAVAFYSASGASGTFGAVAGGGGLTTGTPWYFTNWASQNLSILANGVDTLRSYNGTTIATITTTPIVVDGPYLVLHKSRLWATKSTEINFSVYASAVNSTTSFPAANQLSVNDPLGGKVTGLGSFFDFLIIGKSTSMWRFVGDISTLAGAQLARYSDDGCTAPATFQMTPYGIIYLGKRGLLLTDGLVPAAQELSLPIRSLFISRSSENLYPTAVGQWYPRKQQYVLKLDPTATEAYVLSRVLVLSENPYTDTRSRVVWVWSKHTSLPCGAGTTIAGYPSDADDGRLLVADANGNITTYDADNQTTDDGAPFTSTIQTSSRLVDKAHRTGRAYRVKPVYRGSTALTGSIRYDQHTSDDVTWSAGSVIAVDVQTPRTSLYDFGKFGRYVSVLASNTGDAYNYELREINLDMRLRSARVWRDTN